MADALISVVMPVYNADATLKRAVDSVLAQTHRAWELLAVDDCSRDGSWATLRAYAAGDARVRPIRLAANGGVAAARNAGLEAAAGGHVAFLDSDDWWHPRKLELQLAAMRARGARVSYTAFERVAEDGRPLSMVTPPPEVTHADMLKSNHIGNLTGMYERDSADEARFLKVGHEDYVFWLDRVRRAGRAIRVDGDGPLAWYLVRGSSVSSNKLRAAGWQWRIYRDIEKLGFLNAVRYMGYYAWHAVGKRTGS
ncbi:MAG TPA: glycosyltransferase family 2 protein [Rhodanobacteraceae bacterium]|nr:glycosyltransferase family 2 protein [Rhodanobacteraceae bacterium]